MKHLWYTSSAANARDFAAPKDFPVTFPRRGISPLSSLLSSALLPSFSSSNDVTSKVQAVKSRRDLENRRSRVSLPSMVVAVVVVVSHRSQVYRTPYRESCPLLPSLDARKEGPILGHFLINVRCRLAPHLTLHPPARAEGSIRGTVPFSRYLVPPPDLPSRVTRPI